MFVVTSADTETNQEYKEPDEDFYRALSVDEFREKMSVRLKKIDEKYAKK